MGALATLLRVIGQVADDAANVATELPLKIGAVADDVVAAVADGDKVHLVTDLYRRLRAVVVPQVLTASWVDSSAVGADAYYPAEAGLDTDIYSTITLTGKVITGADNTSILTIEVTNDDDATPGNRDWKAIYVYDNAADSNVPSLTSAVGTTTTFAWSLNGLGFKYVRAKYDITKGTTNNDTVIIKAQYRSN